MDIVEQFRVLARYNAWMNAKLYACAADLTDEERCRDLGAFFRSVHGTLNHLLLADRAWLYRFTKDETVPSFDASGAPIVIRSLDQILYDDFAELRRERDRTDAHLQHWTAGLTNVAVAAPLAYRTATDGRAYEQPLWQLVTHLFNHQTHHRGQVTTLLKQLGRDPGVTDLAAMLRTEAATGARVD